MSGNKQVNKLSKMHYVLFGTGAYGLLASLVLTHDAFELLKNPDFVPPCSINPVLSCLSAMGSAQAEIAGLPNSVYGIMAYTSLLVVTTLLLFGGRLPRAIWHGMLLAAGMGTAFMLYLFTVSVFVLQVICPWCFGIWVTTPVLFIAVASLHTRLGFTALLPAWLREVVMRVARYGRELIVVWVVLLMGILAYSFWDYWSTLI